MALKDWHDTYIKEIELALTKARIRRSTFLGGGAPPGVLN